MGNRNLFQNTQNRMCHRIASTTNRRTTHLCYRLIHDHCLSHPLDNQSRKSYPGHPLRHHIRRRRMENRLLLQHRKTTAQKGAPITRHDHHDRKTRRLHRQEIRRIPRNKNTLDRTRRDSGISKYSSTLIQLKAEWKTYVE